MIITLALASFIDPSTIILDVDKLPAGLNLLSSQVTLTLHYIIISPEERSFCQGGMFDGNRAA